MSPDVAKRAAEVYEEFVADGGDPRDIDVYTDPAKAEEVGSYRTHTISPSSTARYRDSKARKLHTRRPLRRSTLGNSVRLTTPSGDPKALTHG